MRRSDSPHAGTSSRPTYEGACPLCGREMRRKGNRLACTEDGCKGQRPLPLHLVLEARKAARLPGF